MISRIKAAVIGTGSLGKEHARIYAELAATGQVEFAGVYDVSSEAAKGLLRNTRSKPLVPSRN